MFTFNLLLSFWCYHINNYPAILYYKPQPSFVWLCTLLRTDGKCELALWLDKSDRVINSHETFTARRDQSAGKKWRTMAPEMAAQTKFLNQSWTKLGWQITYISVTIESKYTKQFLQVDDNITFDMQLSLRYFGCHTLTDDNTCGDNYPVRWFSRESLHSPKKHVSTSEQ
jgi:hypothetical protein